MTSITPFGVTDFLPEDFKIFNERITLVQQVFEASGYQPIKTPTLEYFNALAVGMGDEFNELAIKFFDADGEALVLRPDHTVPIARLVASRMRNNTKPTKLYYTDSVYRNHKAGIEKDIESLQAGLEFIGESTPEADAQVISLCVEAFLKLGISDIAIDIGHTDFAKDLPQTQVEALLKGDYVSLGYLPQRGKQEVVQDHAYLLSVFEGLKNNGFDRYVWFNRGLVKSLNYYTGLIFEGYSEQYLQVLASGGRYDQLLAKFGYACPAVGFALDLSALGLKKS